MIAGAGFMSAVSFGFIFLLFKGWLPYSQDVGVLTNVLIFTLALVIFGYSFTEARFTLFFNVTGKTRAFMPVYVSRLRRTDVFSIIALIVLKYVSKPVGLVSRLKPAADGEHFEMPELRLSATIQIDEGDEARYDQATATLNVPKGSKATDAAGGARPLLLPALTTPLMSTLLANRNCPVLVFGAVNTKNRFEFIDPEACRDPVKYLELQKATVMGRLGGSELLGRRVKRGMEFDIVIEVRSPRKGLKESKLVFRQVFTTLTALSNSTKPTFKGAETKELTANYKWTATPTKAIDLEPSAPQKWIAVSADYNPIHVSSRMAKMFGFPGRIAHGNHVLACALEKLHTDTTSAKGDAQARINNLLYSNTPSVLEVQFKRPMVLPTKLDIEVGAAGGKYALRALNGDKEYLTAQVAEFKP